MTKSVLVLLIALISMTAVLGQPLTNRRSFQIDIGEQPVTAAAVSESGTLYVADMRRGRVASYAVDGRKLWDSEVAPELRRKTPIALDADAEGRVFVYESYRGEVHVFNEQGLLISRVPVRAAGLSGGLVTGALAADGEGGFYLLGSKDGRAVHLFDSAGRLTHSVGKLAADNASAKGWVGVGPRGSVYFRSNRDLKIDRFAKDASPLPPITPAVPYDATGDPGDSVFTTRVLPDGRIVMEIAHRTPYRAVSGGLATSIQLKTYILSSEGKLLKTVSAKGLGQLGGVSRDSLYFMTVARGLLRAGEGARVHQLALN